MSISGLRHYFWFFHGHFPWKPIGVRGPWTSMEGSVDVFTDLRGTPWNSAELPRSSMEVQGLPRRRLHGRSVELTPVKVSMEFRTLPWKSSWTSMTISARIERFHECVHGRTCTWAAFRGRAHENVHEKFHGHARPWKRSCKSVRGTAQTWQHCLQVIIMRNMLDSRYTETSKGKVKRGAVLCRM